MSEENDKREHRWRTTAYFAIAFLMITAGLFVSKSCQQAKNTPELHGRTNGP